MDLALALDRIVPVDPFRLILRIHLETLGVFDDGRKVYIQFPDMLDRVEAPALFIVKKDGKVQLVNYRKKGMYYEVDRLFERADLRVGSGNDVEVVRITYAPVQEKYKLYW